MIKQYGGYAAKKSGGAREILPAGGYVAKIVSAKVDSTQWGDKLIVAFDIAEGDYREFFKKDFDGNVNEDKKWRGVYRLSIPADDGSEQDEWKKRSFNNFAFALENSNNGYVWDWDESKLKGKMFGVLFRNKEWEMNGRTGWTTEACSAIDAQSVRDGKFKMPKDKPLNGNGSAASSRFETTAPANESDDDLPF